MLGIFPVIIVTNSKGNTLVCCLDNSNSFSLFELITAKKHSNNSVHNLRGRNVNSSQTPKMSDRELEGAPIINWFDSESEMTEMSTINTTLYLGVNVGQTPINTPHDDLALGDEEGNAADSAPNTGT